MIRRRAIELRDLHWLSHSIDKHLDSSRQSQSFSRAWALIVLATAISLVGCCPPFCLPTDDSVPQLDLCLGIQAQALSGDPDGRAPIEGMPFALRFVLTPHEAPGAKCSSAVTPLQTENLSLTELRYTLLDETNTAYFSDSLVLYGLRGPGEIILAPGLTTPEGQKGIRVVAELDHEALTFDATCPPIGVPRTTTMTVDVSLRPISSNARYEFIRSAYLRRHLLEIGRGLSWTWLKEFEPSQDRKELLFHSRTFRAPDDTVTRVYVPWTFNCGDKAPKTLSDGTTMPSCGRSIHAYADSVFAGSENPLLRGGIAMAAFAIEARRILEDPSLQPGERTYRAGLSLGPAMGLLEYFEASEWVDRTTNRRTGFFLRTRWPGNVDATTNGSREYFFASMDEIIGMTLGLSQLHKTLALAGDSVAQQRVQDLTHRLAQQLQQNHYFVLPYVRTTRQVSVTTNGHTIVTDTPRMGVDRSFTGTT